MCGVINCQIRPDRHINDSLMRSRQRDVSRVAQLFLGQILSDSTRRANYLQALLAVQGGRGHYRRL